MNEVQEFAALLEMSALKWGRSEGLLTSESRWWFRKVRVNELEGYVKWKEAIEGRSSERSLGAT